MPDIKKLYKEKILPEMKASRKYENDLQVPRLKKIVLNCGLGTKHEKDTVNEAKEHIAAVTGQAPVRTKSSKNISNFKLRKGMQVGLMVTLRGAKMFDFLDRLVHNYLPRVRDFRGIPKKGFDGKGNYNLGIQDVSIFTEIDLDKLKHPIGLNITMVTSAKTDEEARELLQRFGMPFAN